MARGVRELHGSERAAGTLYESFDQKNKKGAAGFCISKIASPYCIDMSCHAPVHFSSMDGRS